MIELHIKSTPEQRANQEEFSNKLHKALVGWKAYINSEVLLNVDNEDETIFIIGPDNGHNVAIEVDLTDIKEVG